MAEKEIEPHAVLQCYIVGKDGKKAYEKSTVFVFDLDKFFITLDVSFLALKYALLNIPREDLMAKLTTTARKKIKKSQFGLPGERKYPIEDKAHARNAKARASQMVKKGKLSSSSKARIDAKADRMLYGKPRKRAKNNG